MNRFENRFPQISSGRLQILRVFDDQNGVFRREADRGQKPDLEINIIWEPAKGCREQGTENAERHDKNN